MKESLAMGPMNQPLGLVVSLQMRKAKEDKYINIPVDVSDAHPPSGWQPPPSLLVDLRCVIDVGWL